MGSRSDPRRTQQDRIAAVYSHLESAHRHNNTPPTLFPDTPLVISCPSLAQPRSPVHVFRFCSYIVSPSPPSPYWNTATSRPLCSSSHIERSRVRFVRRYLPLAIQLSGEPTPHSLVIARLISHHHNLPGRPWTDHTQFGSTTVSVVVARYRVLYPPRFPPHHSPMAALLRLVSIRNSGSDGESQGREAFTMLVASSDPVSDSVCTVINVQTGLGCTTYTHLTTSAAASTPM
jgi:hypothetical protein